MGSAVRYRPEGMQPAYWPAPRGYRDPSGPWFHTLATRPLTPHCSERERVAVTVYRDLAAGLVAARAARKLSLRAVAGASGVSLSVVTGVEQGSQWPQLATFTILGAAVGLALTADGDRDVAGRLASAAGAYWSLRDLAFEVRMRPNTVFHFHRGVSEPSMRTVIVLANALDCRLAWAPLSGA